VLGEDFLELDAARAQALLVNILRDRLEHRPRGLEAVGERIVLASVCLTRLSIRPFSN
jgi:hypothetical protein